MLSDKLSAMLKDMPELQAKLDLIADKFSKRAIRLGQGEPILTRETMYLMAVEMQLVMRSHGLDARVIVKKKGDGAEIVLAPPEAERKIFKKSNKDVT